jgi:Carbohydrate-binding module 48 (Isoamylase N-terminal domain)
MVLSTVPRRIAKLEYSVVRLPFSLLLEHVVTRYWDEEARLRLGFERFLGSLDGFAGRILADNDICRRGQARMRRAEFPAIAGQLDTNARARRAQADEKLQAEQAQARQARERAEAEMDDEIAANYQEELEDNEEVRREAHALTDAEQAQAEQAQAAHAADERAVDPPDMSVQPAPRGGTVDVTFTLPAEVQAGSVVLCGEFNEWSAEGTRLEQGSDGSWRATVALEPGHSYRYRYLLDGERWENGWQADGYVPNSYGSEDSVVVVE